MFIIHFLLLLAPLIFFHEFGHFLVARWMGVRVLSFSIGFGPVLWAWHRDGTEYAVRAFPLGGFVRMHGEDPSVVAESSEPPDEDSFAAKPVWRRTLIVAAGPIANFILPIFILFFGSLIVDGKVISSRIGSVEPGGPAAMAGLHTGDRIVSIDDIEIETFADLRREISARPAARTRVGYERLGERHEVTLVPDAYRDVRLPELGLVATVGRIQVRSHAQSAIVSVQPDSPAWRAGLRSGWKITAIDGDAMMRFYEVERALVTHGGTPRSVAVEARALRKLQPRSREQIEKESQEFHDGEIRRIRLDLPAGSTVKELGLRPAETVVGVVLAGSPADKQGRLLPGDEIVALDGRPVAGFLDMMERIRRPFAEARAEPANRGLDNETLLPILTKAAGGAHKLRLRRLSTLEPAGYITREVTVNAVVELDNSERPVLRFGIGPMQRYEDAEMIANTHPMGYAWEHTWNEMGRAMKVTLLTVAGLFKGDVPVNQVGGPLFMAQLAARTADLGWMYFFNLMVWISINLAILNLLPIPLVDGGQLLFLAIEAVKREPVSLRTRMIASYVGMSFIGLMFVVVMKNDLQRLLSAYL